MRRQSNCVWCAYLVRCMPVCVYLPMSVCESTCEQKYACMRVYMCVRVSTYFPPCVPVARYLPHGSREKDIF